MTELFRSQGLLFSSDRVFNPHLKTYEQMPLTEATISLVDKYVEFFSLLCLQEA